MRRRLLTFLVSLFVLIFISGCSGGIPTSGTYAWIDVPIDGLTMPLDQVIQIEGHAASSEGVAQVEIWIEGVLAFTIPTTSAEGELVYFTQSWTPPGRGHYTVQTLAISASGTASQADSVRILVGDVVSPTPVEDTVEEPAEAPTVTPTEVSVEELPAPSVEVWVEPAEVQAGECANIYWRVENAQSVRLGSSEVPAEGHYEACHCSNELYRLTVTHLDGSEEEHQAIVQVTGSCDAAPDNGEEAPPDDSPAPSADTAAPAAPTPSSPSNGSDLGCVSSASLSWSAVSDPSGIAEYRLEVQRHAGDNNWSTAPGTPLSGLGSTGTNISVECGWTYRWRVLAVDGAGNVGAWSGWFQFNVPLI